jgi:sporulation protein YlmC with PRC-barrel domain
MKTSLIMGAALAILGLAAAPLIAQTQTTTNSTSTGYVQTSKIIGTKVKTSQGEEVGVVKDVVLDRGNGCMAYTVLSTGGGGTRLTGQSKLVAVPWSIYTTSPDASYLTVSVERDRIYNAPVFEYSHIGDTTYATNVYSHFGVSAGPSFSEGNRTSTTIAGATNTTAGAATSTNSMNNPPPAAEGPSASAAPTGSPMATASPNPSASTTASPDAKASASPKSGGKGHVRTGTSPASPRHKGDETMQGNSEESTSEGSEGSSGKKSSARTTDEESSTESAGTPSSKKSSHRKSSNEGTSETAPTPDGEQE